ncbi:MAG: GHMP kinase, partial [Clostridia bacterium]|nr:GHMP kinase [Clostridia bacterium]
MINEFQRIFPDSKDIQTTFCPYRICPIGAHIDHQYGVITGFAIDKGIHIAFCPNEGTTVEIASMNFDGKKMFDITDIPAPCGDWADYLRGAAYALVKAKKVKRGIKALIRGSLPIGGLSSSAAVILAFISALCTANNVHLTQSEFVYTAQKAENEYVGVNCGKLDQSCEVYCKKDHLLYLDNKDDSFELIARNPNMKPFEIAVFFSGVERKLVGSAFNARVDELKAASYALKGFAGIEYGKFSDSRLRDVPIEIFEKYKDKLPENWRKRATHYYTEFE